MSQGPQTTDRPSAPDWSDEYVIGSILSAWLAVRRGRMPKEPVELDSGVSWETYDAEVLARLGLVDPADLPPPVSEAQDVLLALRLACMVEAKVCGHLQARACFSALTGYPEDLLEMIVSSCLAELLSSARHEFPDLMAEPKEEETLLDCRTHGKTPWKGTIFCEDCGAIWQAMDEDGPRYAPEVCTCGARLLPDLLRKGGDDETYSARPICQGCFDAQISLIVTAANGFVEG